MCLELKDTIEVISMIVLSSTAFLAPYLIEKWKRNYHSPKLEVEFKLEPPCCHLTNMVYNKSESIPVYYFRFAVHNNGKTQAEDCEVFLEKIFKENSAMEMKEIKDFFPVNLKWSGLKNPITRRIHPNEIIYCDIGKILHPSQNSRYFSEYKKITKEEKSLNKFFFELPEIYYYQWDCLLPGKYKVIISVYNKNSSKVTKEFNIYWSGKWKDTEKEMFNELVIT